MSRALSRQNRSVLKSPTTAWGICLAVVYVLYTIVPLIFFNDGGQRIAGMPSLLFWFTLLPWIIPGMMLVLYIIDGRMMRELAEDGADE